jgi:hypothetical protein
MNKNTSLGQRYDLADESLAFIYAHTAESGGIFGLQLEPSLLHNQVLVEFAPHCKRIMVGKDRIYGPFDVDYVDSPGDGTSHGATWSNFSSYLGPIATGYRGMTSVEVEYQIDGLSNMALEGERAWGGGWSVIRHGLSEARDDLSQGLRNKQEALFQGLFYLATNFAELEAA